MIRRTAIFLIFVMACCIYGSALAQGARLNAGQDIRNIIPMRERVQVEQGFWDWKRENVLPEIMREQGVDLWIIRNNEEPLYRMTSYKEHPVFTSLLPANHEGMVLPSSVAKSSMDVPEFLFYVIVYLVKQDTKNYDDFFFFFLPLGEGVSRSFFEG